MGFLTAENQSNSLQNTEQSNELDKIEIVADAEREMVTMRCIAAGSCKFKLFSRCRIVFCDGEALEESHSTIDGDKIIQIE